MSADALPISPTVFASALQDLPISALHLKVLELRNSIAHLDYSNEQLRPFAEGTATALSSSSTTTTTQPPPQQPQQTEAEQARGEPDADCLDAIRENEQVIERMQERIRLVRAEVERRGLSWVEFSREDDDINNNKGETTAENGEAETEINGVVSDGARHSAWTDGTFQTGVIRAGGVVQMDNRAGQPLPQGGSLTDDELRRRVEEQLRGLGGEEEDDDGEGMHL